MPARRSTIVSASSASGDSSPVSFATTASGDSLASIPAAVLTSSAIGQNVMPSP